MFEPLGNTTILPPTQWHPEPEFRGTFSILSTCLITMSLCIWTSLHLNLPAHGKEYRQKYFKLGWMVLGLLAPELVVWNAWKQRKDVKRLSALMTEKGFMPKKLHKWKHVRMWCAKAWRNVQVFLLLRAEDWPEPKPYENHNGHMHAWSDVHSWFVVMGGTAFEDTSPEDQQFMPGDLSRLPLSLAVFEWVVEERPHLIPDVSRRYIEDKSKSDWLAKSLTCWQAGYFCIQCIFRLSQQLSITLLELNVFAHAVCALLIFLVWWDKPRDVTEPILIRGEEALDICAYLYFLEIHRFRNQPPNMIKFPATLDPFIPSVDVCCEIVRPTTLTIRIQPKELTTFNQRLVAVMGANEYEHFKVQDSYWRMEVTNIRKLKRRLRKNGGDRNLAVEFTSRDIARLVRVYKALEDDYAPISSLDKVEAWLTHDRTSNWSLLNDSRTFFDGPEVGDFSKLLQSDFAWLIGGVTFAGACYGGLHLIAWESAFPSQTEVIMWRVASITILVTGPLCAITATYLCTVFWLFDRLAPSHDSLAAYLGCFFILVLLLWYLVCRTFIVVECFILLAHIPETALHVPTWAAYIPSFG